MRNRTHADKGFHTTLTHQHTSHEASRPTHGLFPPCLFDLLSRVFETGERLRIGKLLGEQLETSGIGVPDRGKICVFDAEAALRSGELLLEPSGVGPSSRFSEKHTRSAECELRRRCLFTIRKAGFGTVPTCNALALRENAASSGTGHSSPPRR